MGFRHFLAVVVGVSAFVSLEAGAQQTQQKSAVVFQAVDSIKAKDLAALGRHGEFRTKSGPSLMYWEVDSGSAREKKDGKVFLGIVIGKLNSGPGENSVMAKVWATDGTMALDRLASTVSRSGDAATLFFGTSADYKACTEAGAACVASLPYVKIGASGELSSSSGKLGTVTK
jgi:hypothetical protein